jgi:hypothetical protein
MSQWDLKRIMVVGAVVCAIMCPIVACFNIVAAGCAAGAGCVMLVGAGFAAMSDI